MIPLYKVFMPNDISEGLNNILYSGQLAYGTYTKKFEEKLREYVGNPNIITVSCNSVFFALRLLDIKQGDEVIVSPMSCLATTQPVAFAGAKVVWADIDPQTGTLSPEDVKRRITQKTKAIIHYHWGGYPGYIDEINEVAKQKGIIVIEDASESFGAEYKGKKLGNTKTDIVCYSFTPVRLPNAIDGGGLAFHNEELFRKACLLRDYGIDRSKFRDNLGEISMNCDISTIGDGCTMNNISGYVGACQMDYLPELYSKQRANAEVWREKFTENKQISSLKHRAEITPSYWIYSIMSENRNDLLNEFRNNGFYASKIHLRNDLYSVFQNSAQDFVGVNEFSDRQLSLPCGWWMNF